MPKRIEHFNDDQLVYVAFDTTEVIDHSDMVHPLIIVDYSAQDEPIGFSVSGPMIEPALALHQQHLRDVPELIRQLRGLYKQELQTA